MLKSIVLQTGKKRYSKNWVLFSRRRRYSEDQRLASRAILLIVVNEAIGVSKCFESLFRFL